MDIKDQKGAQELEAKLNKKDRETLIEALNKELKDSKALNEEFESQIRSLETDLVESKASHEAKESALEVQVRSLTENVDR